MKCVPSDLAVSGENQPSGNGGARGGAESSYPQVDSPESGIDLLEQELMVLHREMVESRQIEGGQPRSDLSFDLNNEAPPAPATPANHPSASVRAATQNPPPAASEVTVKPKPKPKLKLKTKVNTQSPPALVISPQPNLTKRQQAQAKEQVEVIIPGIQKCVAQLGWSPEQVAEFIQSRFNGRRRSELSHDELVLLLYRLQTERLEQAPPDS